MRRVRVWYGTLYYSITVVTPGGGTQTNAKTVSFIHHGPEDRDEVVMIAKEKAGHEELTRQGYIEGKPGVYEMEAADCRQMARDILLSGDSFSTLIFVGFVVSIIAIMSGVALGWFK